MSGRRFFGRISDSFRDIPVSHDCQSRILEMSLSTVEDPRRLQRGVASLSGFCYERA